MTWWWLVGFSIVGLTFTIVALLVIWNADLPGAVDAAHRIDLDWYTSLTERDPKLRLVARPPYDGETEAADLWNGAT